MLSVGRLHFKVCEVLCNTVLWNIMSSHYLFNAFKMWNVQNQMWECTKSIWFFKNWCMFRTCNCSSERIKLTSPSINFKGCLLLTLFICLHNQLSSFNSFSVQVSEKRDWRFSYVYKINLSSFNYFIVEMSEKRDSSKRTIPYAL